MFNVMTSLIRNTNTKRGSRTTTISRRNKLLLQYVNIPGYTNEFRNLDNISGGGGGAYIRDDMPFKRLANF